MNIKKRIPKFISLLLSFAMAFGGVTPAYAVETTNSDSMTVIDGEDIKTDGNLEDVTVTYRQASSFFVTIPKTIILDGWKQSTYAVKVSGDIDAEQCVYVAPVDGIADTENIDFYMKDQASENAKDDVVASVTHNKFHWNSTEVAEGHKQDDNLVSAPDLTAGAWRGIFQMEIKLETHVTHKHNYVETITKEPTCTEAGEKTYTCDCGDSYTEEITAKGHHFENGECTDCGEKDPNHTHSYDAGVVSKEPTCTETGEKTYTCICGDSYTETIPATGHHYENGECTECGEKDPNHVHGYSEMITKEPTCTEVGEKTYTCGCGDSYTETIPAKGHNYVDGECTDCGEADPNYVYPIGTQANAEEWNYTLDDENNIITLNYYISKTVYNVTVYGSYEVDGKIYETRIKSNTNNVVNYYMFSSSCSQYVKTIHFNDDVDTSDVTNMHGMFYSAQALTDIYFGDGFDTSNVTDMAYMFYNCNKLKSLDLSKFNTSNVTNMQHMFYGCGFNGLTIYALDSLDLSNFDTSNVTNMYCMFAQCGAININLGNNFDVSKVTNMSSMFQNCARLNSLDLSDFNAINVTKMDYMFSGCTNLVSLDLSNFKTSKVTTMIYMFNNCKKLTNLDLSSLTTENVTYMQYMFCNCSSLTDVNLSSFNTAKVQDMEDMFENCSALITLDLSSFDISKTSYFTKMFYKCSQLKTIYATQDKWKIKYGATTTNMFANCGTSKVTYK